MQSAHPQLRREQRPRIYVVVPVHNRKVWTERFLLCIEKQTWKNFEVILVDDGSTDGTAELVRRKHPAATLLRGDGNLWWTGAINLGIRHVMSRAAEHDAVLIINDDVEIDSGYLGTVSRLFCSMPRTLIGSVLVDIDHPDVISNGGNTLNWWTAKLTVVNRGRKLAEFGSHHVVEASFLTGRGTLIPIAVLRHVGLYDDAHFQQCGDTELPVRANKHGYRLIVSYAAVVKTPSGMSAAINVCEHYRLSDAKSYFLGIKSNCRLYYRFFFALKSATSPLQFMSFLIFDLSRVTWHFVSRLRLRRVALGTYRIRAPAK